MGIQYVTLVFDRDSGYGDTTIATTYFKQGRPTMQHDVQHYGSPEYMMLQTQQRYRKAGYVLQEYILEEYTQVTVASLVFVKRAIV